MQLEEGGVQKSQTTDGQTLEIIDMNLTNNKAEVNY
jgi:hypothetical protein